MARKINLTYHAIERAEERLNLNASQLKNLARKAKSKGFHAGSAPSQACKQYLLRKTKLHPQTSVLGYKNLVFIFDGKTVLTIYKLPYSVIKTIKNGSKTYGHRISRKHQQKRYDNE